MISELSTCGASPPGACCWPPIPPNPPPWPSNWFRRSIVDQRLKVQPLIEAAASALEMHRYFNPDCRASRNRAGSTPLHRSFALTDSSIVEYGISFSHATNKASQTTSDSFRPHLASQQLSNPRQGPMPFPSSTTLSRMALSPPCQPSMPAIPSNPGPKTGLPSKTH